MSNIELEKWQNEKTATLKVSKQFFHHHAYEIMNTHNDLRDNFLSLLSSEININPRIKQTKAKQSKAIEAGFLNKEIRRILTVTPDNKLKFEVFEERGVFYWRINLSLSFRQTRNHIILKHQQKCWCF